MNNFKSSKIEGYIIDNDLFLVLVISNISLGTYMTEKKGLYIQEYAKRA